MVNAVFTTNTVVKAQNVRISYWNRVEKLMLRMLMFQPLHRRQVIYPMNWRMAPPNRPRTLQKRNFRFPFQVLAVLASSSLTFWKPHTPVNAHVAGMAINMPRMERRN